MEIPLLNHIMNYSFHPILQKNADFKIVQLADSLNRPWSFAFLPDNSVLITERRGKLLHLKNGRINLVKGLPEIPAKGQGGLLDIVLHPDF